MADDELRANARAPHAGVAQQHAAQTARDERAQEVAPEALRLRLAHQGLKNAIGKVLGVPWQRCTVHFLGDMLGHVQKTQQQMVGAAIRQVFAVPSREEARAILTDVVARLERVAPKVARLLEDAEADLLAFLDFPAEHRSKLRSTNLLERVNREIGRRSDVIGIYPNDAALIRLAASLLVEQNDEWLVMRRYLSQESIDGLYATNALSVRPTEDIIKMKDEPEVAELSPA